jgi:hypothetical protein
MSKRFRVFFSIIVIACMVFLIPAVAASSSEQSLSDTLTRGSRFTVTVTGLPNTTYYLWLTGTHDMTGLAGDQPPYIADGMSGVKKDPASGPYLIGMYEIYNGNGMTIRDDVANNTEIMPSTNYYAAATTDSTGVIIVEFYTSTNTKVRSYSVKVENPSAPESTSVNIEQKAYSRKANLPIIITPTISTRVTTAVQALPPTQDPATQEITTGIPDTTPVAATSAVPTQKSGLETGVAVLAIGLCMIVLVRKEHR